MPTKQANRTGFDRFTLGHLACGLIIGLMGAGFWTTAIAAAGWEIIETPIKYALPGIFPVPTPDSFTNASVDALAWIVGWGIIQLFPKDPRLAGPLAKTIFGK